MTQPKPAEYWQNIFMVLGITFADGKYEYQGGELDPEICSQPGIIENSYGDRLPLSVQSAVAAHYEDNA
jgi:hypothetical protein